MTRTFGWFAGVFLLFMAVLGGCRTDPAARAAQDATELAELQQTLAKAWLAGDRAAVERIIAPEWKVTGPDGRQSDRAMVLAQVFETRIHKIEQLQVSEVEARSFGEAAVVTGRTHGVGEVRGEKYDVVIRFTDTFVRRDGRWQAVASHASLVQ